MYVYVWFGIHVVRIPFFTHIRETDRNKLITVKVKGSRKRKKRKMKFNSNEIREKKYFIFLWRGKKRMTRIILCVMFGMCMGFRMEMNKTHLKGCSKSTKQWYTKQMKEVKKARFLFISNTQTDEKKTQQIRKTYYALLLQSKHTFNMIKVNNSVHSFIYFFYSTAILFVARALPFYECFE